MTGTEANIPMLRYRLALLDPSPVYRHVVIEFTSDLAGRPKPLWVKEHWEEFAPWHDRLQYEPFGVEAPPGWARENAQREAFGAALRGQAGLDDVILVSDVDELPARFEGIAGHVLEMTHLVHSLKWKDPEPRTTAAAARLRDITTFSGLRWGAQQNFPRLPGGGWHLSWFGGAQAAEVKLGTLEHVELPGWFYEWMGKGLCARYGWHLGPDGNPLKLEPAAAADLPPGVKDWAPGSWWGDE